MYNVLFLLFFIFGVADVCLGSAMAYNWLTGSESSDKLQLAEETARTFGLLAMAGMWLILHIREQSSEGSRQESSV